MRAMIYEAYGGPDELALVDAPRPVPTDGEVRVRVLAGSPTRMALVSGRTVGKIVIDVASEPA